jgi:carbon storage regulator
MIGDDIEVKLLDIKDGQVKIGIIAPREVAVHWREVYLAIQAENQEATAPTDLPDISNILPG